MARIQAARGTEDLLPERIPLYEHVFGTCRAVLEQSGYREIRTPLFEETTVFARSLGATSDVVEKEMFTVVRGETNVTFRPEATASVVRAYLQHNLDKVRPLQKLYYIGPMFRAERPQAGRLRQFDQIGIEALGSSSPLLDAEVIALARRCFDRLGVRNVTVHLNSLGDRADRERFREVLRGYVAADLDSRCESCRRRFETNVFRLLDCKNERCRAHNAGAPRFLDHLGAASRERFDATRAVLDDLGIAHQVDHGIVRGLDYYTHVVFELRCPDVGARDAVCGGGRYDGLLADFGGPDLGAVGFAIGVVPTILALQSQGHACTEPAETGVDVFVAPVGDAQRRAAFLLAERLRAAGLSADTDFEDKSLRAQLRAANRRGVRLVVVLGPDEIDAERVKVKDLRDREELELAAGEDLAAQLRGRLDRQ